MEFTKILFVVIEALVSLLLIGIILLQKSKSEGLGLAFGSGMGESLFGARAGNVLTKATIVLGIVFLANTLLLGVLFAKPTKNTGSNLANLAAAESTGTAATPESSLIDTTTPSLDAVKKIPAGENSMVVEVPAEEPLPVADEM